MQIEDDNRPPTPDELLEEAQNLIPEVDLWDYRKVIDTLRIKGLSWRKVAEWLNARDIKVSHNQLYYFVTNRDEREFEEMAKDREIDEMDELEMKGY